MIGDGWYDLATRRLRILRCGTFATNLDVRESSPMPAGRRGKGREAVRRGMVHGLDREDQDRRR